MPWLRFLPSFYDIFKRQVVGTAILNISLVCTIFKRRMVSNPARALDRAQKRLRMGI